MKVAVPEKIPAGRAAGYTTRRHRRFGDPIFSNLTLVFALVVVGLLIGMVIVLNIDAFPAIRKFGLNFISSLSWNPVTEEFGALPAIFGTLAELGYRSYYRYPDKPGGGHLSGRDSSFVDTRASLLSHRNAGGHTQRHHRAVGTVCHGALRQKPD